METSLLPNRVREVSRPRQRNALAEVAAEATVQQLGAAYDKRQAEKRRRKHMAQREMKGRAVGIVRRGSAPLLPTTSITNHSTTVFGILWFRGSFSFKFLLFGYLETKPKGTLHINRRMGFPAFFKHARTPLSMSCRFRL